MLFSFLNLLVPRSPHCCHSSPLSLFSLLCFISFSLLLLLSQLVSECRCSLEVGGFDVCLFVCVCPSFLFLLRSKPISTRRQKKGKISENNKKQASLSSTLSLNDSCWRQINAFEVFYTQSMSEGKKSDVLLFIFLFVIFNLFFFLLTAIYFYTV